LWDATLKTYGRVDLIVNGAGLYEPLSSAFWHPPGKSPLAEDAADAQVGMYKTFAVNTIAPIRLAQIAVEYWLRSENRHIKGNILWIASMAGYIHGMLTPLYFSSKAATVSICKSLGGLNELVGIRSAAICPVVVDISAQVSALHGFSYLRLITVDFAIFWYNRRRFFIPSMPASGWKLMACFYRWISWLKSP
jgi:NAD(P)-dependent dehydrogenase (short-subunit alcohol dehydrogenase family)